MDHRHSFDHLRCRWLHDPILQLTSQHNLIGFLLGEGTFDCNSIQTTLRVSCNLFLFGFTSCDLLLVNVVYVAMVSNFLL